MQVRPARPTDVQWMMELAASSAGAAEWTRRDYEAIFVASAPRRYCLVAEIQPAEVRPGAFPAAAPAGFLVARAGATAAPGEDWEIENLAVPVELRRRGVASALLREVLDLARVAHARALFLEVRASNAAAQQLYLRHGFALRGRRNAYYSDPTEDALLLERVL